VYFACFAVKVFKRVARLLCGKESGPGILASIADLDFKDGVLAAFKWDN
jgi:hypothetical protein